MIGILNTGGEYSDFYAVNPASSSQRIFTTSRRTNVTYAKGGRVFINGQPQALTAPKQLWDNLLTRAISNSAIVASFKAAGLEPKKKDGSADPEAATLRNASSEASLPELVSPVKQSKAHSPMKICRRRRRSSSC